MALNNVPLANQTLGETQAPINDNFNNIDAQFAIDHQAFNTTNNGFHNKVTFPQQGAAPAAPAANMLVLYNVLNADTAKSEIYLKRDDNSSNPITAGILLPQPLVNSTGNSGWTILPCGLLVNWGVTAEYNFAANETYTFVNINFNKNYAHSSSYIVLATAQTAVNMSTIRVMWYQNPQSANRFNLRATAGSTGGNAIISWVAIGR